MVDKPITIKDSVFVPPCVPFFAQNCLQQLAAVRSCPHGKMRVACVCVYLYINRVNK
jgi:hypothetical protein